jgi:hypothetical protein
VRAQCGDYLVHLTQNEVQVKLSPSFNVVISFEDRDIFDTTHQGVST